MVNQCNMVCFPWSYYLYIFYRNTEYNLDTHTHIHSYNISSITKMFIDVALLLVQPLLKNGVMELKIRSRHNRLVVDGKVISY